MRTVNALRCIVVTLIVVTASLHSQDKYPITRLTSDSTREGFPSWSPDGKTIVYSFFNIVDGKPVHGSQKISSIHPRSQLIISLDIKCPSSEMHTTMDLSNLQSLTKQDQIKFVIATEEDYIYAKDVLQNHDVQCTVFLQPVWGTNTGRLTEWILKDNLPVRLGLQLHKIIWGEKQGV